MQDGAATLERCDWITLSAMQDIGGCRAVKSSVKEVDALVSYYTTGLRASRQIRIRSPRTRVAGEMGAGIAQPTTYLPSL